MRGLISAVVVTLAVLLQLAVADRIAFPGGTGPDLVLLAVAALALATGPMAGSITGFCAGLVLDVAPPAGHYVGQDALVFCLVGYASGLIATAPAKDGAADGERSALLEIGATAAAAICGEALTAALGKMLSDPRVSWPAVKHVLPVAIGYDVLLSPFVLFAVAALLRLAGAVITRSAPPATVPGRGRGPRPIQHRGTWTPAPSAGAVRQVSGIGGSPRLRLGRGGPAVGGMPGAGFSGGSAQGARNARNQALSAGAAKVRFGGRRGEGALGGSMLGRGSSRLPGAALSGRNGLTGRTRLNRLNKLAGSRLGATLLGGSVFSRPATSPFGSRPKAHSAAFGSHQPRFRRVGALTRLVRGMHRPDRPKKPGKRWLRASGLGAGIGGGLGKKSGRALRSPGRGWLGRPKTGLRPGSGAGASLRKSTPRFRYGRGPARLRMKTSKKSWRRSGGLR